MWVTNLREKFTAEELIVARILPAHAPGVRFYEDIRRTNAALDAFKLNSGPKVHIFDLWSEFTTADGALKPCLFYADNIHLTQAEGYRCMPLLQRAPGK